MDLLSCVIYNERGAADYDISSFVTAQLEIFQVMVLKFARKLLFLLIIYYLKYTFFFKYSSYGSKI